MQKILINLTFCTVPMHSVVSYPEGLIWSKIVFRPCAYNNIQTYEE